MTRAFLKAHEMVYLEFKKHFLTELAVHFECENRASVFVARNSKFKTLFCQRN